MAADHWMRFNVGDYLADTMHLTALQHGVYILLIMHYFKRGELPADAPSLARIAKVSVPNWKRVSDPVMALFRVENGVTRHRRIDAERQRNAEGTNTGNGQTQAATRAAAARARPEPEPEPFNQQQFQASPPDPPVNGGGRRTRRVNGDGGRKREPKNGFVGSTIDDLQETIDAEADDTRQRGATVVPIFGRALSG
jgi:uncharacterized protein YdaU (DUF1376 family)